MDLLRGFAMLLVVLGHTMTGSTTGAEDTLLFNFIWSVQMPLFFIISGYVTKYSQPAENLRQLWLLLKKRTTAYLMPWVVWTFLIRGLLLGETAFFDVKYLLWHMDAGYWYLISLWTISVIFATAQYVSASVSKGKWQYAALLGSGYGAGMMLLLAVGLCAGLSFWNIKLTLYYMLFYMLGVLVAAGEPLLAGIHWKKWITVFFGVTYAGLLWKINFYHISDNIAGITLRILVAVLGCILIWRMSRYFSGGRIAAAVTWIGKNSMGIYLSHYVFLGIFVNECVYPANSAEAVPCVAVRFVITVLLSVLLSWLLDRNPIIRKLFLGK